MVKWAWVEGSPQSQLQTSEFNQIPWKVKVYFSTNKISFQRPKAPGKDHWLHSPACTQPWHHRRSRKLTFFLVTVSNKSQKIISTANYSFHRHRNTKGTLWTCWLLSQKLIWTSWNTEDMEGLCTFSDSWWSQKHTSWAYCSGVTQSNQMLCWVSSLLLLATPPHTHTLGKPTSTGPRDPSVTQVLAAH